LPFRNGIDNFLVRQETIPFLEKKDKKMKPENNVSNMNNSNKGTSGFNKQYVDAMNNKSRLCNSEDVKFQGRRK